jgi:hypothetical protein
VTSVDQGQAAGALGRLTRVGRGLGRIPVTLITLSLLLIAGIATGTLFAPANPDNPLIRSLEFGLPAYREGRVWTAFTGAVTFRDPEFYLFVGGMLAVGLGLYERRVGSLRSATALIVTHGVVLSCRRCCCGRSRAARGTGPRPWRVSSTRVCPRAGSAWPPRLPLCCRPRGEPGYGSWGPHSCSSW